MTILSTWSPVGTPAGGVPAGLADACLRVGRDLLGTIPERLPAGFRWMLAEEGPDGLPAGPALGWWAGEPLFWRGVDVTLPDARLALFVADLVQDHLTGYAFVQWPECPGHTHPLEPVADAGEAWWRCPASHRKLSPIGLLAGPAPA
ncbi:hypothetical protein [Streptomyces rubellomurinus]|uniref:Uncharacterized protein n=1 Tax=Streptomyces rubellomurinus (strain ATCC 31215) TaxID=359131 RepID=A0A0F2TP29_STRR3|nr:hypothetical protein [Streptomyces rubellomurinus]KJS63472.1 hypothetical protein VM95_02905 [Streptomyces rubellomurinus]